MRALLTDARPSKDPARVAGSAPGPGGLNRHLVHADLPEHARLRALVNSAFVPRGMALPESFIASVAHRLLGRVEHRAHVDIIADFAAPLTFRSICAILGVPDHLVTAATRSAHHSSGRTCPPAACYASPGRWGRVQWQRIAVARACPRNAPALVMDEPTGYP